jgi:hypothetical protein
MFAIPESEIDTSTPMPYYGVDLFVAVELRNWLSTAVQGEIWIFDVMQNTSLTALATKAALKSRFIDSRLHPASKALGSLVG